MRPPCFRACGTATPPPARPPAPFFRDGFPQGANSLFKHTDLSECITGVVMVKIWGGTTVLMRSWGKVADKEIGLAQVEEGVGYALTRPGLMTFPMW